MLSMIDGVEQLQTFFGQYLPQFSIAACAPLVIFAVLAFWDVPVAAVMLGAALVTLVAPALVHKRDRRGVARAPARVQGVRRGVPRRDAGPADAEGVRPERAPTAEKLAEQGARAVRQHDLGAGTNVLTRGITDLGIASARRRRWRSARGGSATAR